MGQKIDLSGQKFGHLTVLKQAETLNSKTHWLCICSCGKERKVATDSLRRGATKGCGSCGKLKHGMDGTKIYRLWCHMRERCYSVNSKDYPNYGGRGIFVCDRWHDFNKFYEDMGDIPEGASLDRIDNDGPYSAENCRWSTRTQQQINKRPIKNTSSKYRGVYILKTKSGSYIRACIRNGNKVEQLGFFDTEEEAAKARDKRAFEIHGPDARLNFPLE